MQNKANFHKALINIISFTTSIYANTETLADEKTNPIQTQLKPKQTQFNPIQTQNKANQTQFRRIRPNFEAVSIAKIGKPMYHYQNYKNKNFSK
jgi:hypothetical protein